VVAYASLSLSKAERRYSVTHKELLVVVTFLRHFQPYLLGRQFSKDRSWLLTLVEKLQGARGSVGLVVRAIKGV